MKSLLATLFACAAVGLVCADDAAPLPVPKPATLKELIRLPDLPKASAPKPSDVPVKPVSEVQKLGKGQLYVIESAIPLVVEQVGTGSVTTPVLRKPPLTVPAEFVVARKPDEADPDYITFTKEFIYVMRAERSGPTKLLIIPAVSLLDAAGKQIPLTTADVTKRDLSVSGAAPSPVDPVDPVDPDDPDAPAPIAADGLHVLVLYETGDLPAMTPAQRSMLRSAAVREYLNSKCPAGADGTTREWRLWDKDIDASGDSKLWQDALKRGLDKISAWKPAKNERGEVVGPTAPLPWIIVSNGKTGYEGPAPAGSAELITLLKKYGGE